jgi:transaldolase
VGEYAVTGATSNPTIFAKAITRSGRYDQRLRAVAESGTTDPQEVFFELGLEDVRRAARIQPATGGEYSGGADSAALASGCSRRSNGRTWASRAR